jgi:RNA-directed DNA polymerase
VAPFWISTDIVSKGRAEQALVWLRWIIERLGLSLNEAKTRVCDAELETFDFLGYTFGPMVFRRTGKTYVGVTPSKKRVKRFKKSLRSELHAGNHAPLEEVVAVVNRKLRGWSQYFSVGTLEPVYKTVDRYTEVLFRRFLVRRHKVPGRGTRPFSNRYLYEELGLVRLDDRRRMSRPRALT